MQRGDSTGLRVGAVRRGVNAGAAPPKPPGHACCDDGGERGVQQGCSGGRPVAVSLPPAPAAGLGGAAGTATARCSKAAGTAQRSGDDGGGGSEDGGMRAVDCRP